MSVDLFDSRKVHHSQNGEDGIIEKLLSLAKIDGGYFVEFGAGDGLRWSNTYRLFENGWSGCLIEGNADLYQRICHNVADDRVLKINAIIEESGDNSLDILLNRHGVEKIDLLSIDVDSDDLRIWEGIKLFDPGIVIIEYNPVIPFDTRYVNPTGKQHGNSALSIFESARDRGYVLIEGTNTNLIFARPRIIDGTGIAEKPLQRIRDQTFQLRYFFGYDGTLLHNYAAMNDRGVTEIFPIPWSLTCGLQPIPRILRTYSENVNFAAVLYFFATALVRCPLQLLKATKFAFSVVGKGKSPFKIIAMLAKKSELTETLRDC